MRTFRGNQHTREQVQQFINSDSQQINQAFENHRAKLETISHSLSMLKNDFRDKEEYQRLLVSAGLDMEQLGQQVDDKLARLFKEQEKTDERIKGIKNGYNFI